MLKKLGLYVYLSQKGLHIEETLMKPNIFLLIKDDQLLEKCNEIWEKAKNSLKRELIMNLHTMKNN